MNNFEESKKNWKTFLKENNLTQQDASEKLTGNPEQLKVTISKAKQRGVFPPSLLGIMRLFEFLKGIHQNKD